MTNTKKGLGRGLSALMGDLNMPVANVSDSSVNANVSMLSISEISPNPDQPRRDFEADPLNELAESIKQKGIIQPIIVRKRPSTGAYEIVAGERRWRAAQIAGLKTVPIVIRDFTDDEVLEIAIIENIQRENLNAMEEALGFRQLMDKFGYSQEKLAEALSKSRSHIANTLRLLNLSENIQGLVRSGKLSAGHARALVGIENSDVIAKKVMDNGMSVRQVEALVQKSKSPSAPRKSKLNLNKDTDIQTIESDLSANLALDVIIDHSADGEGGTLKIKYKTYEDLDLLCKLLSLSY